MLLGDIEYLAEYCTKHGSAVAILAGIRVLRSMDKGIEPYPKKPSCLHGHWATQKAQWLKTEIERLADIHCTGCDRNCEYCRVEFELSEMMVQREQLLHPDRYMRGDKDVIPF